MVHNILIAQSGSKTVPTRDEEGDQKGHTWMT